MALLRPFLNGDFGADIGHSRDDCVAPVSAIRCAAFPPPRRVPRGAYRPQQESGSTPWPPCHTQPRPSPDAKADQTASDRSIDRRVVEVVMSTGYDHLHLLDVSPISFRRTKKLSSPSPGRQVPRRDSDMQRRATVAKYGDDIDSD